MLVLCWGAGAKMYYEGGEQQETMEYDNDNHDKEGYVDQTKTFVFAWP